MCFLLYLVLFLISFGLVWFGLAWFLFGLEQEIFILENYKVICVIQNNLVSGLNINLGLVSKINKEPASLFK